MTRRASSATALAAALCVALGALGGGLVWRGLEPPPSPDAPLPTRQFDLRVDGAAPTPPAMPVSAAPTTYGPDRLGIPSLGVDAPLVPESASSAGDLVIPGDPTTVGRWRDGPGLDATAGTTLLAGHVSVAGVGAGALSGLYRLRPGDLIVTTDPAGRAQRWAVDALVVRTKDQLPDFPAQGPRRLAVVTCGGPLLHEAGGNSYRDNVIAFASPVPG